ncbi:hypothetical protein FAUST_2683 [Fusarium austroamericanum]|uniref:Uncharacterized protein n=1 Tax=Fusarium austroamericanum TaxID=282268 RepID=A0AAN6C663_FUSAU|nr:hypothetical protein FAUST_2683 [Fusarium austroamericanum]
MTPEAGEEGYYQDQIVNIRSTSTTKTSGFRSHGFPAILMQSFSAGGGRFTGRFAPKSTVRRTITVDNTIPSGHTTTFGDTFTVGHTSTVGHAITVGDTSTVRDTAAVGDFITVGTTTATGN